MKKSSLIIFLSLLLCGCRQEIVSSIANNNENNSSLSSEYISINNSEQVVVSTSKESSSSKSEIESSVVSTSEESSSKEEIQQTLTINEVLSIGKSLAEGQQSEFVRFEGLYVKALTDNFDKLMLFVDEESYIFVRVDGGFDDYLKNRYLSCRYLVEGKVSKNNGNIEVKYQNITNLTSEPESYNYSNISLNKNSIEEVYQEINNVKLNNKDTGVGKIVTFEATIVASDEDDSNTKVVVYDENNVITVIDDKTICSKNDMGQKCRFTGVISVLKTSPAIMLLDKEYVEKVNLDDLSLSSAEEVVPSYFSKWYYTSNKQSKPSLDVYKKLYKITGYITEDSSRTSKYYLGVVDENGNSLSDNGITTSIKGVYLMNNLNMDNYDLTYSPFYEYYVNEQKVSFYASFYQFDTNNHGWKIFALNHTISLA